MQAVRISLLRIRMALGAGNFLRRGFVDQPLHIRVAIHASEEIAVDRMLQLGLIDIEADLLAVDLGCQGCVGVTGKAVCILRLMLGIRHACPCKQG